MFGGGLDLLTSLFIFFRYRNGIRENRLLLLFSLPWFSILSLAFSYDFLSFFWLLKIYSFDYAYTYERQSVQYKHRRFFALFMPFCMILLTIHTLSIIWILVEYSNLVVDYTIYNKSFYFVVTALTTVGFGDISPSSNSSRIFACVVMLLGVGVYGFIITQMSRFLMKSDGRRIEFHEKMEQLDGFFKHHNIQLTFNLEVRIL